MAEFTYNIEQLELESLAQPSKITKKDQELIGTYEVESNFTINDSKVGLGIYALDNTLLEYIPDYKGYIFESNSGTSGNRGASIITLDPIKDIKKLKYDTGDIRVLYNFTNNLYSDTQEGGEFFIQEISSDRTEIKALSLKLEKDEISSYTDELKSKLEDSSYFSQFRVDHGDNVFNTGINVDTLETEDGLVVLLKLYTPLADTVSLKDSITINEIISDSLLYEISANQVVDKIKVPKIKGPNFNLDEVDDTNEPTAFLNYNELFSYPVSSSHYELFSLFNSQQAEIAINHSDYSDFIHFSSAEERLRNFQYKLQLLESYETSLNTISASKAASGSFYSTEITGSQSFYEGLIRGVVDNFDHYDRYLYFTSESTSWPKSTSSRPYKNYATTASAASTWFNTQLTTATNYDVSNVDILTNTIPAFIREDSSNESYLMFIHMIAQHFDNLWIYFKAVSDKYDADNRLNFGVSKDLVREAVESFGINLFSSNQNADNLFSMYLGETWASGSETINTSSVATSATYNNGSSSLSHLQPIPKQNYEKEIYKRIYHNLPQLIKTKGTERGLRALINCFGIPESILSIKKYGGVEISSSRFFAQETPLTSSVYDSGSFTYRSGSAKIRLDNTGSYVSGSTLSQFVSIEQTNKKYTDDLHNVEIAFDSSKGTDEFIKLKSSGSFDIDSYIGDPGRRYEEGYPKLEALRKDILSKELQWEDLTGEWNKNEAAWEDTLAFTKSPKSFIRLLNFFDSSLFKIIKDFLPARAKVDTGIVIKSNILARSKAKQVELSATDKIYSASIITNTVTGSQGGVYDTSGSSKIPYTTNHNSHFISPLGSVTRNVTDESPMYTGELSGSLAIVTDGELGKNNPFLDLAQPIINLDITVFNFSLPPPPACVIALTGSYLGENYTVGIQDHAQVDETLTITHPTTVSNITSAYNFPHDFDTYEFFTVQASGVNNYGDYLGTNAVFEGWYTTDSGGTLITTNNPLTIYRYDEATHGTEYYAKYTTYTG